MKDGLVLPVPSPPHAKAARDQGYRDVSGGFAFREMVKLSEPQRIMGQWGEGTNKEMFIKAGGGVLATNATNVAAAKATWTGQQAALAGFTEVEPVQGTQFENDYFQVKAIFIRPGQ